MDQPIEDEFPIENGEFSIAMLVIQELLRNLGGLGNGS